MVEFILGIIWIIVLIVYIAVSWKDAKSNNEVKKIVAEMNSILLEQNAELVKANQNLNRVIISVCSKSVRDRKDQTEKKEKTNV